MTETSTKPPDHVIRTTPLRGLGEISCATLNVAVPFPLPAPVTTVMNDCCGVAVQEQPAVMVRENCPPVNVIGTLVGVTDRLQMPACVIVMLRPPIVSVPDLDVVLELAA